MSKQILKNFIFDKKKKAANVFMVEVLIAKLLFHLLKRILKGLQMNVNSLKFWSCKETNKYENSMSNKGYIAIARSIDNTSKELILKQIPES